MAAQDDLKNLNMVSASMTLDRRAVLIKRYALTGAYFVSFIALGLTTGSLGPTLPALGKQTNSSISFLSYVFAFRSLGYVLGALRSGRLFDRYPGNKVLGWLTLAAAISVACVPFANLPWLLFGLMFVLGAAEAGIDVGANTLLVRVHQERVAPFMSAMHACFGIGALTAPLIVARLAASNYLPTSSYFVLAVILLPLIVWLFNLDNSATCKAERIQSLPESRVILFCLAGFLGLYVGAEVGFAGWIFSFAVETKLGSTVVAAYLTSLFWGSLTAGRVLLIPVAARFKPRAIVSGSLTGAVLSLASMFYLSDSIIAVSVATTTLGLSMASIFPATLSFAREWMSVSGNATGWFVVGASIGATTLPLLIGQLFTTFGPRATILIPLLALLVAAITWHRLQSVDSKIT